MGCNMDMQLDGLEQASNVFNHLQPELKRATAPVIKEMAERVAKQAKANVNTGHPHNLFRKPGTGRRLSPSYRVKKKGEFWWIVQTPGTAAGRSEAMAEFMARGFTPQGAALVRALNSVYGREGGSGGGRILYKTRDDLEAELTQQFTDAVNKAARDTDRRLNG